MAHPADLLLGLIAALLAPMFLGAGDVALARRAALGTVASYGARGQAELLAIAQLIGFGLAALDSLCLSFGEVPLAAKLRLRGNANGLSRSAQQSQRALDRSRREPAAPPVRGPGGGGAGGPGAPEEHARDAVEAARAGAAPSVCGTRPALLSDAAPEAAQPGAVRAAPATPVAAAEVGAMPPSLVHPAPLRPVQVGVAQAGAAHAQRVHTRGSPPRPAPPRQPPAPADGSRDALMWASAMAAVAGTLSGGLASLPSAEGRADRLWAEALGSHARSLAADGPPAAAEPPARPGGKAAKPG